MNLKLPVAPTKKGRERTISVGELIKKLSRFDPKTPVVYHNGWVTGVSKGTGRVQTGENYRHKCVQIDLIC